MAGITITRLLTISPPPSFALPKSFHRSFPTQIPKIVSSFSLSTISSLLSRPFSNTTTTQETPISNNSTSPPPKRNTLVNFSLFNSEDSDTKAETKELTKSTTKPIDKSKLPPPYDPFNKKPVIKEFDDPTNLQKCFRRCVQMG
ncbi:hypothetical protein P3L10_024490 [Capsicum annuum]